MIFDQLSGCQAYLRLSDSFARGFEYLRSTDLSALPDGRYSIRDEELIAIVQSYLTRPQGRWEAHRHHADIQFIVRGAERMGVCPLGDRKPQPPYDPDKDVEFYAGDASAGQVFTVSTGQFAVFFPHDLHMPSLMIDQPAEVKKVVIKIRLD